METLRSRVKNLERCYNRQNEINDLKRRVLDLEINLRAVCDYLDVQVTSGVQIKKRKS